MPCYYYYYKSPLYKNDASSPRQTTILNCQRRGRNETHRVKRSIKLALADSPTPTYAARFQSEIRHERHSGSILCHPMFTSAREKRREKSHENPSASADVLSSEGAA
jgi:hypothetical protein